MKTTVRERSVFAVVLCVLSVFAVGAGNALAQEPPLLFTIVPAFGPAAGGTTVTIAGFHFESDATVTIGGTDATVTNVVNNDPKIGSITATTPPGDPGPADVVVTNPGIGSDMLEGAFTYFGVPVPITVNPNSGPVGGGTEATVAGFGFAPNATVTIDGIDATVTNVVNRDPAIGGITLTTPAGDLGPADVVVTNPGSAGATLEGGFTYLDTPLLFTIAPTSGPIAGGTTVTISGFHFAAEATVTIGGAEATVTNVLNRDPLIGSITATTPPGDPGPADVVVTNPGEFGGSDTLAGAFTYLAPPEISGITPAEGPTEGGTQVTIDGSWFAANATVTIGGAAATGVTVTNPGEASSQITATTPPGDPGPADVVVTNPGVGSDTLADGFTYISEDLLTIDTIEPDEGPETGGTGVTITGTLFGETPRVQFGSALAWITSWNYSAATKIYELYVIAPPSPSGPGLVRVTVTNLDLPGVGVRQNGFTYLDVTGVPVMRLSPLSLEFAPDELFKTLVVANVGEEGVADLNWSVDQRPVIVDSVEPNSGLVPAVNTQEVTVKANRRNVSELGTVEGVLVLGDRSLPDNLMYPIRAPVLVRVSTSDTPVLAVDPPELEFGIDDQTLPIALHNLGVTPINSWSITAGDYISGVSPSAGSNLMVSQPQTVQVTVDRTGLAPGVVTTSLTIESDGGTVEVQIVINVPEPPVLEVDPDSLFFDLFVFERTFRITNGGVATLEWSIAPKAGDNFITVQPASGSTHRTSTGNVITVTVDKSGLTPGAVTSSFVLVSSNGGTATVNLEIDVPTLADLTVVPDSLYFGPEEFSKTLTLSNGGEEPLNYTASSDAAALDISPSGGTITMGAPVQLLVTADKVDLPPGLNQATIEIEWNYGTVTVPVTIDVSGPILGVEPDSLRFEAAAIRANLTITNQGVGLLQWVAGSADPFITSVKPASGTTGELPDSDTVGVLINRDLVPASAINPLTSTATGTITVSGNGGTIDIPVEVVMPEPGPRIAVQPESLNFPEGVTTLPLFIANSGIDLLQWTVEADNDAIGLDPTSGQTLAGGETDTVIVSVDRRNLAAGTVVNASITVTPTSPESGDAVVVPVTIQVPEAADPVLQVLPTMLTVEAEEGDDTTPTLETSFTIANIGNQDEDLDWLITVDAVFVSVSPESGTTTTEVDTITVTVDRRLIPLDQEEVTAVISVTSNGGDADVDLTVLGGGVVNPQLEVVPQTLVFAVDDNEETLTITNAGTGTLQFEISVDAVGAQFVTVVPESGEAGEDELVPVAVSIDRNNLPATPNPTATLTIDSNGGSAIVTLTVITVMPVGPSILVAPRSITIAQNQIEAVFTIRNIGTGTPYLTWDASANTQALMLEPSSNLVTGLGPGESETVLVTVDRSLLPPSALPSGTALGEGTFTITILSNDANKPTRSVNVTVRTTPEPMLVVKPAELYFGQSENEATLMLHNLGLGELVYEAGATAVNNALTIRLAGAASAGRRIDGTVAGLGSEMVIVEVDRAQLDLIELIGFISISSNGGAVVVPVGPRATTLEIVVPPDDLLVTLTDFGAGLTLLTRIPVIAVTDSLLDTAWIEFMATVDGAGIEIDLGSDVAPPYAVALDETYLALVPVQDRPALVGDSITFTATLYAVSGGPMEPIATDSITLPIIEFSDTSIDTNGDGVIDLEEAIGYDPTGDGVPDGRFFDIAQPATPKRSESLELDDAALASPESVLAELDAAGVTVQDLAELYDAAVNEDGVNIGALVQFAIENPEAVTLIAEKAAALGLVPGDAKVLDQPEVASRLELLAPDGVDNVIYAADGVIVTVPDATLGGSYSAVLVTTAPDALRLATVLQVLGPAASQDANALYNAMFAAVPPEVGQLRSDVCQVELMGASNTFPQGVTAIVEVPYADVDNNGVVDGTNTVVTDLVPVVFDNGVDKTESRLVSFTLDRANRVGILEVNGFSAMALTRRLGAPPAPPPPPPPSEPSWLAGLLGIFIAFIMFLLLFGGSLPGSAGGGEECFIATAAYGTPLADQLDMLRAFRDMYLLSNPVGTDLVRLYYTHGPVIADWIANSAVLRMVMRSVLWVVVGGLRTLSFAIVPVTVFALATLAWVAERGVRLRRILAGRK